MATLKEKRLARITRTAAIRANVRKRNGQSLCWIPTQRMSYSQLALELVRHLRGGAMNG